MQAGSDGRTACATCHFHAGADHRLQNQLAPPAGSQARVEPNQTLTAAAFPFHHLANPLDNRSEVLRDTPQVAGSAGVPMRQFVDLFGIGAADAAADPSGMPAPAIGGLKVRQVTTRNTPTVINAVFNTRNFWDGRARRIFTGATPFGDSDGAANVLVWNGGSLVPQRMRLENASVASVAVAPPLNTIEMSYGGRSWAKVGKKMLTLRPLALQAVSTDDSVLGAFANAKGKGLGPEATYASFVSQVFRPAYWESPAIVDARGRVIEGLNAPRNSDEYTQMEFNFAAFWSLAIQAYAATLVSDDSRFDRFMDGETGALTSLEVSGLTAFQGNGRCIACHRGPELTTAGFTSVPGPFLDNGSPTTLGFFRVGVSRAADDVGGGGTDGFGVSLFPGAGTFARGVFKTPGLRNVELTGPYFHTGSLATLEQLLEFYSRRGDFPEDGNQNIVVAINLSSAERAALLALLKSMTDDRVRFDRAPFDHPSLCVPVGYDEETPGIPPQDPLSGGAPVAGDRWRFLAATGRRGHATPLQTFEELLQGIGNDGSRSHTMTEECR